MRFIFNFYNTYLFKNNIPPGKESRSEDVIIVYSKYLRNGELHLLAVAFGLFKIRINSGGEKLDVTERNFPTA